MGVATGLLFLVGVVLGVCLGIVYKERQQEEIDKERNRYWLEDSERLRWGGRFTVLANRAENSGLTQRTLTRLCEMYGVDVSQYEKSELVRNEQLRAVLDQIDDRSSEKRRPQRVGR